MTEPRILVLVAVASIAANSCHGTTPATPAERTAAITTGACGDASGTSGSGIVVDRDVVLTAAHVVIGATSVDVTIGDVTAPGTVVRLDPRRDLASVRLETPAFDPVSTGFATAGSEVSIHGSASGPTDAVVVRRVTITVDDVRATSRSKRDGYELDTVIAKGDSGAGVFDAEDRLVGVVFSESSERTGIGFAVSSAELHHLLEQDEASYECDPTRSRIVEVAG